MSGSKSSGAAFASVSVAPRLPLLEAVFAHSTDAVLIAEVPPGATDPRIVEVNAAFARMSGYAPEELVGRSPRVLEGPLTSPEAARRICRALADREPLDIQLLNYRKSGETYLVEAKLLPIAEARGSQFWIVIERDITSRHRVEVLEDYTVSIEAENTKLSREIAERERAEARLAYSAFHDELTGLHNRAYFTERLATALARLESRHDSTFAVLFFDLDRFKIVNDTLGHAAGDLLLQNVATRLRAGLRQQDVVARLGGDEFAILLESVTDSRHVVELSERLIGSLCEPVDIGDATVATNVSIGITLPASGRATTAGVLRDADTAMYRAKRAGGNRFAVFDEAMHREALATFRLHGDLRHALDADDFALEFQPMVRLDSRAVVGFEALVRWHHPARGLVLPSEFIAIAEETGVIVQLGRRVLELACAAMQRRREISAAARGLRISVNVSTIQLRDATFPETVRAVLDATGLPASALQLEIGERAFSDDAERAGRALAPLRAMGVAIALDRFGTGRGSLADLERFATDALKIDRSFVTRLPGSARDVEMLRTIVRLGSVLGLDVLAEGVETEAQCEIVRECGCTSAQGFYFARPLGEAEAFALLDSA